MLKHFKGIILEKIDTETNNPQNWRIKKWIQAEHIDVKRLLKDMQKEGLIDIKFVDDRGKIRRILKKSK